MTSNETQSSSFFFHMSNFFAKQGLSILAASLVTATGIVVGVFDLSGQNDALFGIVEEKIKNMNTDNYALLGFRIFLNNFLVALLMLLSGALFGLYPAFTALVNGMLLGIVCSQITFIQFLQYILPHGIIELPLVVVFMGYGMKIGTWVFRTEKKAFLKTTFSEAFSCLFRVGLPGLALAAFIETMVIYLDQQYN